MNSRIRACRTAFHALQGAGLCNRGLNIETSMYVWSVACKSVLTYACHSMYLNNENLKDLNKLQGKLVKCIVGLSSRYRTTPLLQAIIRKQMWI